MGHRYTGTTVDPHYPGKPSAGQGVARGWPGPDRGVATFYRGATQRRGGQRFLAKKLLLAGRPPGRCRLQVAGHVTSEVTNFRCRRIRPWSTRYAPATEPGRRVGLATASKWTRHSLGWVAASSLQAYFYLFLLIISKSIERKQNTTCTML